MYDRHASSLARALKPDATESGDLAPLNHESIHPWYAVPHEAEDGTKSVYYVNSETNEQQWEFPGYVWQRKLAALERLKIKEELPEFARDDQIRRHYANAAKPSGWLLLELPEEKRKRNRAERMKKQAADKEKQRRKENPNDFEQVEDVMRWLVLETERISKREKAMQEHNARKAHARQLSHRDASIPDTPILDEAHHTVRTARSTSARRTGGTRCGSTRAACRL